MADFEKCSNCLGTGYEPFVVKKWSCICCDGTGRQADFTARVLSGVIEKDERGDWWEPYTFDPIRYKGVWDWSKAE